MITTCTKCGGLYEAGSEEQAYEPERFCFDCRKKTAPLPAANPPTFGGGSFSTPTPPAPSRCPSCGVKEATAVCRWCGCWKFSRAAIDAAFRNILAGKFWRVMPVLLLMVGCTTIQPEHKDAPAGWPELEVTEHVMPTTSMIGKCYAALTLPMKLLGGIPLACAWVDLCAGTCEIYVPAWAPAEVLEHERLHCKGHDHLGDDTMARLFGAWRGGACKR